ncbi:hypothetical protein CBL_04993 [Carabus blaptoides fortunei]
MNDIKEPRNDEIPEESLRFSLPGLINTARELIHNLTSLQSESILNSQSKFSEYLKTIEKLEAEYLHQGSEGILSKIQNAMTKIQTIVERSKALGEILNIDVTDFFTGRKEELDNLGKTLINSFKDSSTKVINNAIDSINKDIEKITNISNDIMGLPGKLSGSLISWDPLPRINELIVNLTAMIEKLPVQITEMVSKNVNMVSNLPQELLNAVSKAIEDTENRANEILKEIATSIAHKLGSAIVDYLLR